MDEIALMREIARLQEQINALRTIEIGGVWQNWTPTVTSQFGSGGTATTVCKYSIIGQILFVNMQINITAVGTAAGYVGVSFPPGLKSVNYVSYLAREGFAVGKNCFCIANANGTLFEFLALDNTTLWVLNYGFWSTCSLQFALV